MKIHSAAELYPRFREFPVVVTDSRKAAPGSIFFALKGDNFDGNRFAETALQAGCAYAVIDDPNWYKGEQYIVVEDCLHSLQELARYHREHLTIPFIAITGSNGKTTTKELIKAILSKKYNVLATAGNLNNHIGVPLTLLSTTPDTEIAVIEMGANHTGEIAALCQIARPNYGLITNIGKAHIGEFGSFDNIVRAKTEMYRFIGLNQGKLFVNADNELLMQQASGMDIITYGSSGDVFSVCTLSGADPYLQVTHDGCTISSHLIGKYNFENIAAAICIGKYFGMAVKDIAEAVEAYVPSNNRSQEVQTKNNRLILDAYNANPSSMKAAIENFHELTGGDKWIILGDMLELGEYELREHKDILTLLKEKNFQKVILVGKVFSKAAAELKFTLPHLFLFQDADQLVEKLKEQAVPIGPSLILIKGSRGIKLEKAADFL